MDLTAMITEALPAPTTAELEAALAQLVYELADYRDRPRPRKPAGPGETYEMVSAAALMKTSRAVLDQRDWADAPVAHALKAGMKKVAQMLFDRLGSTDKLCKVTGRIAKRNPKHEDMCLSILNSALDGVGNERDFWAA